MEANKHCPCLALPCCLVAGWVGGAGEWIFPVGPVLVLATHCYQFCLSLTLSFNKNVGLLLLNEKASQAGSPSPQLSLPLVYVFQLMGEAASIPALNGIRGRFLRRRVWECVGQKSPSCRAERGGGGVAAAVLSFTEAGRHCFLFSREEAGVVFLGGEGTADSSSKKTARGWGGQIIGGGEQGKTLQGP